MVPMSSSCGAHFRRFMLRGLAVLLPPVLTIVIIIWVANTVNLYVLDPINTGISKLSARVLLDTRDGSDLKAEFKTGEGEQKKLPALEEDLDRKSVV